MPRWLRAGLRIAGIAVALAVVVFVALAYLGIDLDLRPLAPRLEELAGRELGRAVRFEGEMTATAGLWPALDLRDVVVANPPGWEGELLRVGRVRLELGVLALLVRTLHVREMRAEEVRLDLRRDARGVPNWLFAPVGAREAEDAATPEPAPPRRQRVRRVGIRDLVLSDIEVTESDSRGTQTYRIEGLTGSALPGRPFTLEGDGSLRDEPLRLEIETSPLDRLDDASQAWDARLGLELAGVSLLVEGAFEEAPAGAPDATAVVLPNGRSAAELGLSLGGERLDSVNGLLGVALPPWGPWQVQGRLRADADGFDLERLGVRVGASDLVGRMRATRGTERPRVEIELDSETIQLDDFPTAGWSPRAAAEGAAPADSAPQAESAAAQTSSAAGLLERDSLLRLDAALDVRIADVRSGPDPLGAGRLKASLEGGRLALDPFEIELPGGVVRFQARYAPGARQVESHTQLRIEEFDYGVLARRLDPASEAAGILHLDVDLAATSPAGEPIWPHVTGHLDFGVFPENLEAGFADLWAVNLFMALLPRVGGSDSVVNCVVGRFAARDGVLQEQVILLDTSRMRVAGDLQVDFHEQRVSGVVAPVPKKPQMFSAATPVRVDGHFEDFGVGVRKRDVAFTVVRMSVSPLTAPLERLIRGTLPRDGREACREALRRAEGA